MAGGAGSPLYIGLTDEKGFPHQGTLDGFDHEVDPRTGAVRARGFLPDPDRLLLHGMAVRIRMPFGIIAKKTGAANANPTDLAAKQAAVKLAEEQKALAESNQKLAEAAIATAKAQVAKCEVEVKQATQLVAQKTINQASLTEVKARCEIARGSLLETQARQQIAEREVKVAEARLKAAQADLADAAAPKSNGLAVKRAAVKLAEEEKALAEAKQDLAQAAIGTAKAHVLRWEVELNQAKQLVKERVYAQATYDGVKAQCDAAKGALLEAEAKLRIAEREVKVAEARLKLAQAELTDAEQRQEQPAKKTSSSEKLEKAKESSFQAEYAAAQVVLLGHFENAHVDLAGDLKSFDIMHPKIDFVIERVLKSPAIVKGKTKVTLPQFLILEGYALPQRVVASDTTFIIFCAVHNDKIDCRKAMPLGDNPAVFRALRWIHEMQKKPAKEQPKAGRSDAAKDVDVIRLQVGETQELARPLPPGEAIVEARIDNAAVAKVEVITDKENCFMVRITALAAGRAKVNLVSQKRSESISIQVVPATKEPPKLLEQRQSRVVGQTRQRAEHDLRVHRLALSTAGKIGILHAAAWRSR
jgi:multidrug resistance efflux pump